VHTQSIESYWAKTKYKFKVMKGVAADSLPSYLDERMWRDRWGATKKDAFESICNHIAEQCKETAAESQTNSPVQG
jgi:3-methyladenine DNA glycosylase/8-oxoguanine DNA glycosylase